MTNIHYFVQGLFRGMSETDKIREQRMELESHINDRLADAGRSGMTEEEAFKSVIASLGNLDELVDAITGERKKIYINRSNWYTSIISLLWGSIYIASVFAWFIQNNDLISSLCITLPGWMGFLLPALYNFFTFMRNPTKTASVSVNRLDELKSSIAGWLFISAMCWISNLIRPNDGSFFPVYWAWLPTFGVLTWPIMVAFNLWSIQRFESLDASVDGR